VTTSPSVPYGTAESLFRAAHHDLARLTYRLLGNEADTQDSLPRVAALPAAPAQRAYLTRIAANEARQILRYPYRRWERLGADWTEPEPGPEPMVDTVQAREDLRLVWKAIDELPGVRGTVVTLHAAGYEYDEIAAQLDIDISTVRSHISNARRQLSRVVPRDWEGAQL
jgi:RNA polymerase sigma factor (sigma-70 family)